MKNQASLWSKPLMQALAHLHLTLPRSQESPISKRNKRNANLWAPGPVSHLNPKEWEGKLRELECFVGNQQIWKINLEPVKFMTTLKYIHPG